MALLACGYLLGSSSLPSAQAQDTALMREAVNELSNIRRELGPISSELGKQR